jgi:predicted small secreted protein
MPREYCGFLSKGIHMFKKMVAQLLAVTFLAGVFGSLAGCNTVEGAGKDIEKGGAAIKEEAREHKNY